MHEAVLLLDTVPVRDVDFRSPMFNDRQRRPNQTHRVLFIETCCDGLGEFRICRLRHVIRILAVRDYYSPITIER